MRQRSPAAIFWIAMLLLWLNGSDSAVQFAYIGPGAGFAVLGSLLTVLAGIGLSLLSLLTWPFRLGLRAWRRQRATRKAQVRRAIFLGLDGFDPELTDQYLEQGLLPNLARLASQGSYQRLRTTLPALSPVAWSTFATGVNPARHNIFDFLNREKHSYLPELSSCKVHPPRRVWKIGRYRIPLAGAWVEARQKSRTFWSILGDHQITSTILRVPITFPPEKFPGRLLSAMLTPDLRGTQGTFSSFTTRPVATRDLEQGTRHGFRHEGTRLAADIEGPPNPLREEANPIRIPFSLEPVSEGKATLRIQDEEYSLHRDQYSEWIPLRFPAAPGVTIHGIARFLLTEAGEHHSLYVTPVNIDPEHPALPISHPRYYAPYLACRLGSFATVGMAEDTWALNEEVIGEDAFLRQAYDTFAEREAMFVNALERTQHGVVACVFDTPDRVQHMFFRYLSDESPETSRHKQTIQDLYQRMDALVGRAMAHAGSQTAFFVLSDHGFTSFRRGVNLNTWLLHHGYLALKDDGAGAEHLQGIDWTRTRAYALGLGGLYLNRKGREPNGIVSPGPEAETLKQEILAKLSALVDDETGKPAVRRVYATSKAYNGPYLDAAPDIIVGFAAGYRISWSAAKGQVTDQVFEDNRKHWSGDHCVDPELVPGVLFSNRRTPDGINAGIEDMAPTALTLFGVTPPAWMEGKPLFPNAA